MQRKCTEYLSERAPKQHISERSSRILLHEGQGLIGKCKGSVLFAAAAGEGPGNAGLGTKILPDSAWVRGPKGGGLHKILSEEPCWLVSVVSVTGREGF